MKIKFKLKETLNDRGLYQKDLVEMTGLRPNAISRICLGHVDRISLDHIERIAEALEINDIREIMTLE